MRSVGIRRKLVGAFAGAALCATSTGGLAATTDATQSPSISPLVALSALGSEASRAGFCSVAISAGAAAVAAQGAPSQGCVLPVVDQAPPAPVSEVLPPPPVPPPPMPAVAGGLGSSTLLLGLAGIVGGALLAIVLLRDRNGGNDTSPG